MDEVSVRRLGILTQQGFQSAAERTAASARHVIDRDHMPLDQRHGRANNPAGTPAFGAVQTIRRFSEEET
jgi:hypothetical protein